MVTREDLDETLGIALAAGAEIMAVYDKGSPITVQEKSDRSPVTEADHAAHAVITDMLRFRYPNDPIISEEGEIAPYETRRSWKRFWLVDPLDGTKEFIQRNGEFTVNIALIEDGVPTLGVIFAPVIFVAYVAGAGLGSWKYEEGVAPRRLYGPSKPADDGVVIVESRSHPSPELEAYLGTLKVARREKAGSSLKFGLVAEGRAHLYPRFGPTMEWDVAAGDCVWRMASESGERPSPLKYNTPALKNQGFVIGVAA